MSRTYSTHGGEEKYVPDFMEQTEREERLGRPNRGREGNIIIYIKQTGWVVVIKD